MGLNDVSLPNVDPESIFVALAELLEGRPEWHADALCREPRYRQINFFPARGEPTEPAKSVCAMCLVRSTCFSAGIGEAGVWGGTAERQRRRVGRVVSTSGREAA